MMPPSPPDTLGVVSIQRNLLDRLDDIKTEAVRRALSNYNAADFQPIIAEQPDATFVAPIVNINNQPRKSKRFVINHSGTPVKSYTNKQREFVNDIYNSYYRNLIAGGSNPVYAKRQARHLAQKSAYETGYGQSIYAKHNYGGHEVPDGKGGVRKLTFKSMDDYTKADIKLLDRKWKPWRDAKNEDEFVTAITTDYGQGRYNAVNSKYRNTYKGMSKRINNYLNMRCGGRTERPKAFLGAVIGALGGVASSLISSDNQKELARQQQEAEDRRYYSQMATNLTNAFNNRDAQEAYERQFRVAYNKGGRRRLRNGFRITDGGYAIPMGDDTFLLRGGSHEDINESGQTGIGLNIYSKGGSANKAQIEAEGGEVIQQKPNEVRVFSDTLGLNGYSFADLVQMGYNKDELFKIQQNMNGDYGKRRLRNGGRLSRPVGRICAENGIVVRNGRQYKKVRYPNSDKTYWQDLGPANSSNGFLSRVWGNIKEALNSRPQPTGKKPKTGFTASNMPASTGPYNANIRTVNKSNTNNSNGDAISKALASKGLANTPENRRLYVLANKKGGTTQAGMEYTGTRNGRTLDEIVVTGNAPYTDLSGAITNREDLSYLDKDDSRNIIASVKNVDKPKSYSSGVRRSVKGNRAGRTNTLASSGVIPTTQTLKTRTLSAPMGPENYYPENDILKDAYKDAEMWEGAETGNTQFDVDDDVDTFTPVDDTVNPGFDYGNLAGGIINGLGSIASGLITDSALRNTYTPREPVPVIATKLPTTYSIGADLANNNRTVGRMLRDARLNTSSSSGLASRRNLINVAGIDNANRLYQTKQNAESEMLTRDALNQQEVNMFNAQRRDNYENMRAQLKTQTALARAKNWSDMIGGLVGAYNDYDAQLRQNRSDNLVTNWYLATLGDKDRRWFINSMRNSRNRVSFT